MTDVLTGWQGVLVTEQAAVYGYGIVGGRLGPDDARASARLTAHERQRDLCIAAIERAGGDPSSSAPAYNTAVPTSRAEAEQLAGDIERDCSFAYTVLIASESADPQEVAKARSTGTRWLLGSSNSQWEWTGQVPALPGLEN